ncbi:MAG: hypothetical protein KF833_18550 [Verrucomicrobiae bacterium]|nr:hypothetical protein [Verrucomicrobiae bacterium]
MDATTWSIALNGVLTICALATLILYWRERGRAMAAERRAAERDAQLVEIEHRGDAPAYVLSDGRFTTLVSRRERPKTIINASYPRVLSAYRNEVDPKVEDSRPVSLVVENCRPEAIFLRLELDGEPVSIHKGSDAGTRADFQWIEYPYDPAKHGSEQTLVLTFETRSGRQGKHRYLTRHGIRTLVRIDPGQP